jgi:long-subunit acyl-CoA synthetase (AMP-forming)
MTGWGMAETCSAVTLGPIHHQVGRGFCCMGTPHDGTDLSIVGGPLRRPLESGSWGELAVRGPAVMKGYYKEAEATAELLSDDGWLYTGRRARLDETGSLCLEAP